MICVGVDVPDRRVCESVWCGRCGRCRRRIPGVHAGCVEILDGESSVDVPVTIAAKERDTSFGSSRRHFLALEASRVRMGSRRHHRLPVRAVQAEPRSPRVPASKPAPGAAGEPSDGGSWWPGWWLPGSRGGNGNSADPAAVTKSGGSGAGGGGSASDHCRQQRAARADGGNAQGWWWRGGGAGG